MLFRSGTGCHAPKKMPMVPKGTIGIFFGAWHTVPIVLRVQGSISKRELGDYIGDIQRLEKMLTDEGVMLVKFWFHLSKDQQKKRLKALEKDPKTAWRVTDMEWKYFKLYDDFIKVCEPFLRETSTGDAPWIVVPGRYSAAQLACQAAAAQQQSPIDDDTAADAGADREIDHVIVAACCAKAPFG